ncbi:MAG TPA: hypothetical protein PKY77_11650 [Phycisphaerae bacterium]|nr:hypothetical protein [Phycisphaerae bacterium]HRY70528.1 hypothetical protein [Phycisphaerae bacterium]HSA27976.1 hypothetical protein [Phycisphaerae bacterium]
MKKARRQELRTNELSIYLQQIYDTAARNANYVIGGAVAVVAILIIGFLIQSNRQAARQSAWSDYYSLRDKSQQYLGDKPDQQDSFINEVRTLAERHKSDRELGPRVMELEVDVAYIQAMNASPITERAKRLTLLKQARTAATQILDRYASQPEVAHRGRMTLAAIEESLLLMGEGSLETTRKLYQSVLDAGPNAFVPEAKKQLESLADRTARLELVATRPAEPPASQPAPVPSLPEPAPAASATPASAPAANPATVPAQ